jgi:Ran GTPase-activating protein 1
LPSPSSLRVSVTRLSSGGRSPCSWQVADLADIFTGRLISEIPQALTALCNSLAESTSLETLDLSDNAFGGRCAEPIVPFLTTNLSFKHFILNNNGMGPTGGNIIAAALLQSAENSAAKGQASALRTFVCGRNRLENGTSELLSKALAAHGLLEVVRLPQNGIRMEGIARLSAGLAKNPNLRHLDLQDNTLTLSGSRAVTALLDGSSPKLETLRLQYGEMDRRSFELLAKAIKAHGSALTTLELNGNVVDAEDDTVEQIRAALEGHGNAEALDERASLRWPSRPSRRHSQRADIDSRSLAVDDMEEDEGEEDEDEDEEAAAESDDDEDETAAPASKAAAVAPAPAASSSEEDKPAGVLDMSIDAMADALAGMTVNKSA